MRRSGMEGLAKVYARAGDFDAAVQRQTRALALIHDRRPLEPGQVPRLEAGAKQRLQACWQRKTAGSAPPWKQLGLPMEGE